MWNSICSEITHDRDDSLPAPVRGSDRAMNHCASPFAVAGIFFLRRDPAQRSLFGKRRGVGLIEVVIAIFLTTVGIMAVMSMQPTAWQAAAKADYLGRAAEILSKELETRQAQILNPCNAVTTGTTTNSAVRASGQTTDVSGDAVYSVTTTITNIGTNIFRVTATVNWNNNASSVTESLIVMRQDFFRFPMGCTNA
jgi:hypothetical protein